MDQQNYTCIITVTQPPAEVFRKINAVSGWWASHTEGIADLLHDRFTVRFGKTFGSFEVTELLPQRRMAWKVVDCFLELFSNQQEWLGTELHWEISTAGGKTDIRFTHAGLTPDKGCYKDCRGGWDFFLKESLFRWITEGKGMPQYGIRARLIRDGETIEGMVYGKNDPLPHLDGPYLLADVRQMAGEDVLDVYSIHPFDPDTFQRQHLRGNFYMLIPQASEK